MTFSPQDYLVSGRHNLYSCEHQRTEEVHETRTAKRVMLGTVSSLGDAACAEFLSYLLFLGWGVGGGSVGFVHQKYARL